MPTYDYECPKGHTQERFYRDPNRAPRTVKCAVHDHALAQPCPRRAKRLIGSGSGVIFKGTGFYETDYKRKRK